MALARSLAKRPQLLLLDEPLGALDKKLREETQIELVNIIEQVGVTCVMVTHDQEEAMTMASRIAVMSEGSILQVGAPSEIYETPATRFVADFIGNVNLMDGTVEVDEPDHVVIDCADCRHYVGHGITGTEGMAVAVAVRPEKIRLCTRRKPAGDRRQPGRRARSRTCPTSAASPSTTWSWPAAPILKVSESNVAAPPRRRARPGATRSGPRWSPHRAGRADPVSAHEPPSADPAAHIRRDRTAR